jgi:hypothetical protein
VKTVPTLSTNPPGKLNCFLNLSLRVVLKSQNRSRNCCGDSYSGIRNGFPSQTPSTEPALNLGPLLVPSHENSRI